MTTNWTTHEEAARLGERFAALKKQGIGQAEFARKYKIPGGASMLSQHIKGRRPMTLEAATIYAKAFGCGLGEISPRIAKEVGNAIKLETNTFLDVSHRIGMPPITLSQPNQPPAFVDRAQAATENIADPFAILRLMYKETPVEYRKASLHAALLAMTPYMDPRTVPTMPRPSAAATPASTSEALRDTQDTGKTPSGY